MNHASMTEDQARNRWHNDMTDFRREFLATLGPIMDKASREDLLTAIAHLEGDTQAWKLHGSSCGQRKKDVIDDLVSHLRSKGMTANSIGDGGIAVQVDPADPVAKAIDQAMNKPGPANPRRQHTFERLKPHREMTVDDASWTAALLLTERASPEAWAALAGSMISSVQVAVTECLAAMSYCEDYYEGNDSWDVPKLDGKARNYLVERLGRMIGGTILADALRKLMEVQDLRVKARAKEHEEKLAAEAAAAQSATNVANTKDYAEAQAAMDADDAAELDALAPEPEPFRPTNDDF